MPRGASPKREKEYEELKDRFAKEGRYRGRQSEVASRIVNKQRARYGETKGARRQARRAEVPDRDLPIEGYSHLTVPQIKAQLGKLSAAEVRKVRRHEVAHKNRKSLLAVIDRSHGRRG